MSHPADTHVCGEACTGMARVFPASRAPSPDREEYARRYEAAGLLSTACYCRLGYELTVGDMRRLYAVESVAPTNRRAGLDRGPGIG